MSKLVRGDRVWILAGDERGSYGVVVLAREGWYHVGLHTLDPDARSDIRIYARNELRKPRK